MGLLVQEHSCRLYIVPFDTAVFIRIRKNDHGASDCREVARWKSYFPAEDNVQEAPILLAPRVVAFSIFCNKSC